MANLHDEVLYDATSLYHFVESICSICKGVDSSPAYLLSSKLFFSYVLLLGEKTKQHLVDFSDRLPIGASNFSDYRRELLTLREGWSKLHQLIKPSTDADTLNLPLPLIEGLIRRFREIQGFSKARFSVFHFHELNYLQVKASQIRNIADSIANIVGAPPFQTRIGMIGIPYSQASSLFRNCLIPHEMGHYVFQNKELRRALLPNIEQRLLDVPGNRFSQQSPGDQSWCIDRIASWSEEIFCDLLAISLVGPCYSFAYIELFDLVNALDSNGSLVAIEAFNSCEFSLTHPADFFRLREQCSLLEHLGWWDEVRKFKTHYVKLLSRIRQIPSTQFHFPVGTILDNDLIAVFDSLVHDIRAQLHTIVEGLKIQLDDFKRLQQSIEECFSHGVVPSTLWMWRRNWLGKRVPDPVPEYPNTVVLLNASYRFYLEKLDQLLKRIEKQDINSVQDRYKWVRKLEAWPLKAIEDHHLLVNEMK